MATTDRRRRYDLRRFREELDRLDSEEIRARLNGNRIRSTERRAMAEEVLRERAEHGAGTESAGATASAASGAAAAAEAVQETAGDVYGTVKRGVGEVWQRAKKEDMPTARQLGRTLGAIAVVGGVVALIVGILRR